MKHEIIDKAVRLAVAGLVSSYDSEEGTVVTLPNIYPSGAPITVRISFDGSSCFVSDMGNAFTEAELLGASQRLFKAQADEVVEEYGVRFDNHLFFALNVPLEKLDGAIRVVGAASNKAVVSVQNKMTEQSDKSIRAELVERLIHVFGSKSVSKDVSIRGSSSHEWRFAGRVSKEGQVILFDTATESANSIFSVHAKFSDVKLVERAPRGVIAVPSFSVIKPDYRNLLQQAANLIEISSSDNVFERLIAAA